MANNNISLEALKVILFRTIEGVENLNDPKADTSEKITIEQARVINDLSRSLNDLYKTQILGISAIDKISARSVKVISEDIGIVDKEDVKLITE